MSMTAATETRVAGALGRYYDPTTAQFLSVDPLFALTGSRYGYAGNDPINGSDPTGLFHIPGTSYCVDIGDPNCHSRADGKKLNWKDTKTGLGITLGIVSVATGFGAVGAAGGAAVSLGLTSLVTGAAAAGLDYMPCRRDGPASAACAGLALGGSGAVLGAAPLVGALAGIGGGSLAETYLLGLGAFGLSSGMAGLFLDASVAIAGDPAPEPFRCNGH